MDSQENEQKPPIEVLSVVFEWDDGDFLIMAFNFIF